MITTTTTCINPNHPNNFHSSSHIPNLRFSSSSYRVGGAPRSLRCSASQSVMDNGGGLSLFPLHRTKTIHLVRHAQGIHNVEGDKNYNAYMSPEYFDARLTELGWQQVDNLRKHVHSTGLINKIDVVITSPLTRLLGIVIWFLHGLVHGLSFPMTIQTAVGVFGGEGYTDKTDILPLMIANAGNSGRAAISSLNSPPILAVEQCREHLVIQEASVRSDAGPSISWGVHPCDKRRSIGEYQCLFPAVDFSLIESDDDSAWKADVRETKEEVATRGKNFFNWLLTRKEKEIAIVTHSGFLFHTLATLGNDCHPLVKKEISSHFANCELRSMVIVDRSNVGSEFSSTNYPGKIPSGLDAPSDAAGDQNQEKNTPNSLPK
ncbi:phosphoglycerate mutase family protein [Striga asiatica]|uniref:Phosphoglycerate mutase family protein n=1 Tax=Striga asiatica TaxID=4170 RepID=A0A5A7QAZ0_STRAF|nr:phosphoglycerate mutase family protein [Striga asiatica]